MARGKEEYIGAYLLAGGPETLERLRTQLEKEGVIERGSPDVFLRSYRSFGIDDARALRERAQHRPVAGERRAFLIGVPAMTTDAQNALLKTIEEPPAHALFFIVALSPATLLPTLRSRMQPLVLEGGGTDAPLVDPTKFLGASPEKRLEMVKPLYMHDEDEERDIGAVILFLQSLERALASEEPSRKKTEALTALYRARKFVGDKGSLLKALLEQVALLTPRVP